MADVATPTTIRGAVRKFLTWTSIRGVPRIVKEKTSLWKLLWTLTVIVFLVVTIIQVTQLVLSFFQFQTTHRQAIFVERDTVLFPSLTVCNQQPFTGKVERLRKAGKLKDVPTLPEYLNTVNIYLEKHNASKDERNAVVANLYKVEGYYQNVPEENISRIAQNDIELVPGYVIYYDRKGSLVKKTGNTSKATVLFHYNFLKCYTISFMDIPHQVVKVQIVMYLDDEITFDLPHEFIMKDDMDKHGAKMALHGANTYPFIDQEFHGWPVPPGVNLLFLLRTTLWDQMEPPFGQCRRSLPELVTNKNIVYNYTKELCLSFCRQRYTKKRCDCVDPAEAIPAGIPRNTSYCGSMSFDLKTLLKKIACMNDVRNNFGSYVPEDYCDCPEVCKYYDFEPHVTASAFPHQSMTLAYYDAFKGIPQKINREKFSYYEKVKERLRVNDTFGATQLLLDRPILQRNLARAVVAFPKRKIRVLLVQEIPKVDVSQLLSSIGGNLSLYLGITVISVVEIVELLFDLVRVIFGERRNKTRVGTNGVAQKRPKTQAVIVQSIEHTG